MNLERWEEVEADLRADATNARKSAAAIEEDSGKDKGYGIKVGEAAAFDVAANRIAGELDELRYA